MADAPDPFASLANTAPSAAQPDARDPFASLANTAGGTPVDVRAQPVAAPTSTFMPFAPKPESPGILSRVGDVIGSLFDGGDKTSDQSLGDLVMGAKPAAAQASTLPSLGQMAMMTTPEYWLAKEYTAPEWKQYVGGGGDLINAFGGITDFVHKHPWVMGVNGIFPSLEHAINPTDSDNANDAVVEALREKGKEAQDFAGNPEDAPTLGGKIVGHAIRAAPTLAATLAVPGLGEEALGVKAAPTLAKIPGLLKYLNAAIANSPKMAAMTGVQAANNPHETLGEAAQSGAVNVATGGVSAFGKNLLTRVLTGAAGGLGINEGATRLQGEKPTLASDIFAALQGGLPGAMHSAPHDTAPMAVRPSVTADTVADALRAANVPEDQIQAALRSGQLDDAGNAITNAQAMERARLAQAAAQERTNTGLTPDVQRAQAARQEGVKAAEAEALQRGAPGELRAPEPEAGPAPVDPAVEQRYFDDIDKEIGWDQEGGHIVRGTADQMPMGESDAAFGENRSGSVTGRTSWVGMQRSDNEGESSFWRNRPANARLTPEKARAALAKARAGEPLKPIEQRFVDYARRQAHDYAQEHADAHAQFAAEQRDLDDAALAEQRQAWRDENIGVRPTDEGEALTLQQWAERAQNAGVDSNDAVWAAHATPDPREKAQRFAQLISEKSHGADQTAARSDHPLGVREGGTGRTAADAETGAGVEEPQGSRRSDLFPAATSTDQLRAAREAKNAERNGLNRPSQPFTNTDLGATPHGEAPEQARIPEAAAPRRFATQREAGEHAAALRGDARVRRVAGDDGKPAWEVTQSESHGVLDREEPVTPDDLTPDERAKFEAWKRGETAPTPVHEVAESDLSPEDQALVQRTRANAAAAKDDADLGETMRRESAERGEREADELGLREPVEKILGGRSEGRVFFLHDEDGLPAEVRKRGKPIKRGNVRYGLHTPEGDTYIFTKHANTPAKAAWTAVHEIGHDGWDRFIEANHDVRVGNRTAREQWDKTAEMALQNPTLAKLADKIGEQRRPDDWADYTPAQRARYRLKMANEAVQELQAATRTGDWGEIEAKYGVKVPTGMRGGVKAAIANFVKRMKAILNAIVFKRTGERDAFSDADVHDMLNNMWEAAKDENAPNLDLVPFEHAPHGLSEEPAARAVREAARDDDLMFSEEPQDRADTMGRGASGPAGEPEPAVELPPRAPGESRAAWHARIMRESRLSMKDGLLSMAGIEPKTAEAKAMRDLGRGGLRAMWSTLQRTTDKAAVAFKQAMAVFDKAGKDANLEAIHQWETGQEVTSAPHRLFFKAMESAFNDRIDAIRAIAPDKLQHVIENYFPHLWEDPTKAAKWYQQMTAKRPLEGNKAFLKQRVHDTIKDGMAAGLKPVSTNPVDLVLAKMAQMDKFIALHRFRQDLQQRGWLKEMDAGERVPYGYARIDDPAFMKAAGLQGYFAVPELIAKDINNYLGPSLYRFKGFKALRKVENLIMMARLGWSAFHAGFTTLDNLVMHADVGLRYMLQGDIKRSLLTLAKTPLSVVYSPFEGGKLNRQWLGLDKADTHTAALLDALEQGGARWKMSSTDYNNDLPKFIRSLRQREYGTSVKTSLSAAGEVGSWLIHHKLVPNQKMAARLLLAKHALDRVAGKLGKERGDYAGIIEAMHPDALKQIMGDVVKNVDDRLGQMNYDNQFWNKTARELAQTAVGAVGWQVGTVRTVTGGLRDIERLWNPKELLSPLDKGGKITDADMGRVSGRLTYLVTLALLSGGSSAALQYMLTGQGPTEIKDYFFPKTGRKNADGSDERLQFPSYWMDHYKLATHPLQTAEHKLHPILSMFMEAISNQDYYGVEIHDPHASWLKQAEQVGEYVAKGFVPYSWTSGKKASSNEAGIGRQLASFVGITNAPASVSRSSFQTFVSHNGNKGFGHEKRTAADADHSRMIHDIENQMRNDGTPDLSGLSRRDLMRVQRESREQVPEIQFKKMSIEDKLDAWDMATPKERKEYHLRRDILQSRGTQTDRFRRLPDDERRAIITRIREIDANR